jgi:hypothetical protein
MFAVLVHRAADRLKGSPAIPSKKSTKYIQVLLLMAGAESCVWGRHRLPPIVCNQLEDSAVVWTPNRSDENRRESTLFGRHRARVTKTRIHEAAIVSKTAFE